LFPPRILLDEIEDGSIKRAYFLNNEWLGVWCRNQHDYNLHCIRTSAQRH
jgi:hypothetical protein